MFKLANLAAVDAYYWPGTYFIIVIIYSVNICFMLGPKAVCCNIHSVLNNIWYERHACKKFWSFFLSHRCNHEKALFISTWFLKVTMLGRRCGKFVDSTKNEIRFSVTETSIVRSLYHVRHLIFYGVILRDVKISCCTSIYL